MENFKIETAQNVNISQNVANIGERILAYIIDFIVMVIYVIIIAMALVPIADAMEGGVLFLFYMAIFLPVIVYHLVFEMFWNGRSLGKAAFKLRVVRLDGGKPSFSNYLLRWLLRVIDISLTSGAVAVVTMLINGRGQRIGDLAAATTVISERTRTTIGQTLFTEIPDDYVPKYPQVTVFTDAEMGNIKQIFRKNRYKKNGKVLIALATRLATVMDIEIDMEHAQFVDKVISDYNYFTQL